MLVLGLRNLPELQIACISNGMGIGGGSGEKARAASKFSQRSK